MATLITQVDRTSGNYQDVFIYTINASFNGVSGDINSAQIIVFFPDILDVYLGDIQYPIQNIEEEIVIGGKNVIFDFGTVEDLGIAIRLGLGVLFKNGTDNGTEYICNPKMYINGMETLDNSSESINLVVETRFELSREVVLPKTNPAPGGTVYYKLTLQNFGDLGGKIENISIQCNSISGLTIDTDFIIIGKDNSTNGFEDLSQDDILGTSTLNTIHFMIPQFHGEKYEFIYKAIIDSEAYVGTELNTVTNWSVNNISKTDDIHTLVLDFPNYSGNISLYGPDYSLTNESICYEINIENNGNQVLQTVALVDVLPQEIKYYEFKTGIFYISEIEQEINVDYFIQYETANGISGTLGPYNSNSDTTINLESIIASDDNLSEITWTLPALGVGVKSKNSPHIKGIIKAEIPINISVLNHLELSWIEEGSEKSRIDNHSTIIGDICILKPYFSRLTSNDYVNTGQIIRYNIGANCRQSPLRNPIIAMLLPAKLEYIGNITTSYTDHFVQGATPITPPIFLEEDFNSNGDTLIIFAFTDEYHYNFKQKSKIRIAFDTRVKIGAQGDISATMLLNTKDSIGIIPTNVNVYKDINNIANDLLVSENYAQSNSIENNILFFVGIASNKKVKGLLDSEFVEEPNIGSTVEGGEIEYKISITNIGNANLEKVEIIDILPYIGDTGVIETSSNRNSEFGIYAISEVVAKILPENQQMEFDIFYSTSSNPIRFGGAFDMIGVDQNWSAIPPENLLLTKSFKIATKYTALLPNQTLEISIKSIAPVGTALSTIAWNSFAADVTYLDTSNNLNHLLAVEPEKVGVEIKPSAANKGKIGGIVWFDSDKDGLISQAENGINDVGVVLYKQDGTPIRATFTAPNIDGSLGYYLFSNLDIDKYYVKFFIENDKYQFTKQILNQDLGSKPHETTGITTLIDLTIDQFMTAVNAGIINKQNYTINQILAVNGSTRSMLRNVIYNQMLISMKYEDVMLIIENETPTEIV